MKKIVFLITLIIVFGLIGSLVLATSPIENCSTDADCQENYFCNENLTYERI